MVHKLTVFWSVQTSKSNASIGNLIKSLKALLISSFPSFSSKKIFKHNKINAFKLPVCDTLVSFCLFHTWKFDVVPATTTIVQMKVNGVCDVFFL